MGELNVQANALLLFVSALIFWALLDRLLLRRLSARARRARGFRRRGASRRIDRQQHLQRGFRY